MDNLPSQILLQIVFILLNAFFAGSEIAFLSLNSVKLGKMAEGGDKTAARLLALVENPNRFLSAIQVAITLSGFLGAAFGTENFSGYLTDALVSLNLPLPQSVLSVFSMVVITIVISFFSIAFGEMVPKRIAMQQPYAWARAALGVVKGISVLFAPMMILLDVTTNGSLRLLGLKTEAEDDAASEEDIRLMVENSGEQGAIAQEEQQWIENVFDFGRPDPEGERPEGAVGRRMGVPADERRSGEGEARFGPDDVHDPLVRMTEPVERHPEVGAVLHEGRHLRVGLG